MVATLTLAALVAQQQTVLFAPKFLKDEVVSYTAKVTGSDEGMDVSFDVAFDLVTRGDAKDGKTPVTIKFTKVVAMFGDNEQAMDQADIELLLDKTGAPTTMDMDGAGAVAYVALVTQYLPNKELKVGDKYAADLDLGGAKIGHEGVYTGEGELEGKKFSVLTSKTTLTPTGQDAGTLATKSFYDAMTGKVVRTESTVNTPDGEFKLVVTAKPKKA